MAPLRGSPFCGRVSSAKRPAINEFQMTTQTLVSCQACASIYTARMRDDGSLIIPTADASCACGNESFEEITD